MIDTRAEEELSSAGTRRIGPVLVFGPLWEESALTSVNAMVASMHLNRGSKKVKNLVVL